MAKHRVSRYDVLSPEQKAALNKQDKNVILSNKTTSFVGSERQLSFFQNALTKFTDACSVLAIKDHLVAAFVRWSNEINKRNSLRNYDTALSQFKNGLLTFMVSTNQTSLPLNEINTHFVEKFEHWLKTKAKTTKGKPLEPETQRRYYGFGIALLRDITSQPAAKNLVSPDLVFKKGAFSRELHKPNKTESLNDYDWARLYAACKTDALKVIEYVKNCREILNGPPVCPDDSRRGRGRYHDLRAALWRLDALYPAPKLFPDYKQFRADDTDLAYAFQYIHGGVAQALTAFYPNVESILPFVLLFGIYTQANAGPLKTLLKENVKIESVIGERILFNFFKPRAHSNYFRSFTVDDSDPLSPSSLYRFLSEWTSRLRPHAGIYSQHVFIFRNHTGEVRGFSASKDVARDSDSSWNFAIKKFVEKHRLPRITPQIIRVTGLDTVSQIFDENLLAQKQAGGQRSKATLEMHYNSSAAMSRREESTIPALHAIERWADTSGHINTRATPENGDICAATPGWQCKDPYNSPIPGQTEGRLCQAYGQCPKCPHSDLDIRSPYAFARVLQLTEEVKHAQTYLDSARWQDCYGPVLKNLLTIWLPSFTSPQLRVAAKSITLTPLARLE